MDGHWKAWLAALAVAALAACDGSVPTAGIGSGGTGGVVGGGKSLAVVSGPIKGFGSVIVNGVRFDDTGAVVTIDGVANRPVSELKLGLVVDVRGEVDPAGTTGRAATIDATYALVGPVTDVQPVTGIVSVLGQRAVMDGSTVLDGVTAVSALMPGDVVAVSGLPDPSAGTLVATRLERRASAPEVQSLGNVSDLTGTTFRLGAQLVDYSRAQLRDFGAAVLANGASVSATGTLDADGVLRATSVRSTGAAVPADAMVEYVGYVSQYASLASFQVGPLIVNATGARFVGGAAGNLANGARVEVEGRVVGGILVAEEVDFLTTQGETAAEVEGAITDFLSVASFKVRDQRIDASGATWVNGSGKDAGNGRVVHVIGLLKGTVLAASTVAFIDPPPAPAAPTRLAVDGAITDFVSPAQFRVSGRPVTTGSFTVFSGGGPADLANGRRVAAEGVLDGAVLRAEVLKVYPPDPAPVVSTSGRIESFAGASNFVVAGQHIAANAQTQYVGGTAASLANGVLVGITGSIANGVLVATRIEIQAPPPTESPSLAEVEGYITDFVSPANFKVQGQRVDATLARYEHGTAATLANGLKVHCTGTIMSGVLKATLVQIDN